MRALTIEECNHIYGGGVGFGEALETVIDGIVEATHASEGAVSLAEALGVFEEKAPIASKYTTDQDVLHMDVYIANNYMHELQTHNGSDKITDSDREKAIDALQDDGRVYFNPLENKFEALGGTPEHGTVSKEELKDPETHRFYEYIMEQDIKNIHSTDEDAKQNALESIKNSTREGAYHYDVTQGKYILG